MNSEAEKDVREFKLYIKRWATKKMHKLEKKLRYYAKLRYEEPMVIVYLSRKQYDEYIEDQERRMRAVFVQEVLK